MYSIVDAVARRKPVPVRQQIGERKRVRRDKGT
jgi:hypothetical protein